MLVDAALQLTSGTYVRIIKGFSKRIGGQALSLCGVFLFLAVCGGLCPEKYKPSAVWWKLANSGISSLATDFVNSRLAEAFCEVAIQSSIWFGDPVW